MAEALAQSPSPSQTNTPRSGGAEGLGSSRVAHPLTEIDTGGEVPYETEDLMGTGVTSAGRSGGGLSSLEGQPHQHLGGDIDGGNAEIASSFMSERM